MNSLERRIKREKEERNRFVFVGNSDEYYDGRAAECKIAVQIVRQMNIPFSDIRPGPPINPETLRPDPKISATQTGIYIRNHSGNIYLGDAIDEYEKIANHKCIAFVLNPDYIKLIKRSEDKHN